MYLGIDQGGTKTAALVCDLNGNVLGVGYDSGLSTVYFNDAEKLYIKRIVNASQKACDMAGIKLSEIKAVCGGLSGADWDFEYPILRERLFRGLGIEDAIVLNDCMVAMRGGSAKKECAVICAGSGLNIALRRADGEQFIYGYYIDDAYQGAHALGKLALQKIVEAHLEISEPTLLTELILAQTPFGTVEDMMIATTTGKYTLEAKTLAPLLGKAIAAEDREAISVMDKFAEGIAKYVTAGMKRMGLNDAALDIVFSGGVFKGAGHLIADRIFEIITKIEPHVSKIHAGYEPVCGAALILLEREHGGELPETVSANFDESARAKGLLRNIAD